MNTQEINGKNYIKTEGEDGTILFTPIVEEVKQREVYVNRAEFIAEVRAALSHEDWGGDSVLVSGDVIHVCEDGAMATREALRKLNIITD